jgi:predicted N-acetyltransferase YhbS
LAAGGGAVGALPQPGKAANKQATINRPPRRLRVVASAAPAEVFMGQLLAKKVEPSNCGARAAWVTLTKVRAKLAMHWAARKIIPLMTRITHLFNLPQHRTAVAHLIHHEFWTDVPGATVEGMASRLALASSADTVPLCLVALNDNGEPVGAVNLVESDDDHHTDWTPWLAGMVVAAPLRGQGIGTALVKALLTEARRVHVRQVYLGSDGPGFYTRLGAVIAQQPRAGFWFLRFDLSPG